MVFVIPVIIIHYYSGCSAKSANQAYFVLDETVITVDKIFVEDNKNEKTAIFMAESSTNLQLSITLAHIKVEKPLKYYQIENY